MSSPAAPATLLTLQAQVHAVIASLSMPDDDAPVAAAAQWANDKNHERNAQGVTAYAKLAGASWTYYIKGLVVRIGRPYRTQSRRGCG